MCKKIVVALGERHAESLLARAAAMSREHDAPVVIVHVVDLLDCFSMAADFDYGPAMQMMMSHGRNVVANAEAWLKARGCVVEAHMLALPANGVTVGHAIATLANETHADLVLLGERRNDWWQIFRNDVAADVARDTCACIRRIADDSARARSTLDDVFA